MDWISREHCERNRQSLAGWESYAGHRARVTELLTRGRAGRGERVGLLGAGNCNDLDLAALTATFAEVHLIDLDAGSLRAAVERQRACAQERLRLHGGVDITGLAETLGRWSPEQRPTAGEVAAVAGAAPRIDLGEKFDVIASVGLLTQLIDSARLAVGETHPSWLELNAAMRARHIRLMVEHLNPGGMGLLVVEVVSSDTAPELLTVSDEQLPDLVADLIAARNFFTGCNPRILQSLVQAEPGVSQVQLLKPWRWRFVGRTYAVAAVRFCK